MVPASLHGAPARAGVVRIQCDPVHPIRRQAWIHYRNSLANTKNRANGMRAGHAYADTGLPPAGNSDVLVGLAGFEPAASATQTRRASQAALQPVCELSVAVRPDQVVRAAK